MPSNVDGNQKGHVEAPSLQEAETSVGDGGVGPGDAFDPTAGGAPRPDSHGEGSTGASDAHVDEAVEPATTEPEGNLAEGARTEPPAADAGQQPGQGAVVETEAGSPTVGQEESPTAMPGATVGAQNGEPGMQDSPVEVVQEESRPVEQAGSAGAAIAAEGALANDVASGGTGTGSTQGGEGGEGGDKAGEGMGPAGTEEDEALAATQEADPNQEEKTRRRLLVTLLLLVLLIAVVSAVFWRYLKEPVPLPDLLPLPGSLNLAPHYLFSIYGVDEPVGVALSPDGERIYASETGGERLVKIFDRDGFLLGSFAPPRTLPSERSPVYLAVDGSGRVFVSDRLQHAVFVYDGDGNYLDTILGTTLTLSEYVWSNATGLASEVVPVHNRFEASVYYQIAGEGEQTLPAPGASQWAPLGIRIDGSGNLLLTDVSAGDQVVRTIPFDAISAWPRHDFDPPELAFGSYGQGSDQFMFPNAAVVDSLDRIYVTDGNNGRVSVWDRQGKFLFSFGQGTGEGAISLPRGAAIDARDRLYVVDAVEQNVKVYDVSSAEPDFLFGFGDWGSGDGQLNYPNDIALDAEGRLYVADRENSRIQVWSY